MSNSYFQFRQFIVTQQKAAMKVCTDSCLFGAWTANAANSKSTHIKNILDIGTGTGLLSLMLAQKTLADIDAVEIDESAAQQAQENFEASLWQERLHAIAADVRTLNLHKKYDLIISNPPFFENGLKSPDRQRNLALHNHELSLEELLFSVDPLLQPEGTFAILLPFQRVAFFTQLALNNNWYLQHETLVKQTEKHPYFRAMLALAKKPVQTKKSEIIIKIQGSYSDEFKALLKDYYLNI